MVAMILEVLSLVSIPLSLLLLLAAFVAFLVDGRWRATTAYVEDGPPRALHWISEAGEVRSRRLAENDPLASADRHEVYYREEDPDRIRMHRRSELFTVLRFTGLLTAAIGIVCAIASTALSLFLP